jgi:hypothetical protein
MYETLQSIVSQLDFCEYQTKDGIHDLKMNAAFIALKERAAAELAEALKPTHNTGSPKLPPEIVESSEPCDYCVDRTHPNCKDQRTEYFPSCFIGRQLRAGT